MTQSDAAAGQSKAPQSNASCLAMMAAVTSLGVLVFFALSFVVVGGRWLRVMEGRGPSDFRTSEPLPSRGSSERRAPRPSWPTTEEERPAGSSGAVVEIPAGRGPGKMRNLPGFENTGVMAYVPSGTPVEVLGERYITEQGMMMTWYKVRANIGGKTYEGWMHSDLVKK